MIKKRDYQATAETEIRQSYKDGYKAPCLVMPCASGKTFTFASIAEQASAKGNKTLILVHRRELLLQASRTLDSLGVKHGLIQAGISVNNFNQPSVYVASVQTLIKRLDKLNWTPDLTICDECHHVTNKTTWGKILSYYAKSKVLGVTASPIRLDGHGLGVDSGGFFDKLIVGPSVAELTAKGYLSPAVVYAPPQKADFSGLHVRGGDFAKDEVEAVMDKPTIVGDCINEYRKLCSMEPAIVFCTSIAHAEHVADAFLVAGYQAASIDGKMDQITREQRISDLGSGKLQVLTSCDIISEGTDIPVVSVGIMLRPTMSLGLHIQQTGRILRTAPGKTRALILDHIGGVYRHGLPDEPYDWNLEGRQKRPASASDAAPVRQCSNCFHVHRPAPVCPRCGYVYPVQSREVEEVDGTLEQVDPAEVRRAMKREQARAKSLEDLVKIGKERGYKNPHAWARFVWQARQAKRAA